MGFSSKSPKIFHVTSVHRIDDPRIFLKECCSLAKVGYEINVLACIDQKRIVTNGYTIRQIGSPTSKRVKRFFYQIKVFFLIFYERPLVIHFHDAELLPLMYFISVIGKMAKNVIFDIHENYEISIMCDDRGPLINLLKNIFAKIYSRILNKAEQSLTFVLAEDSYQNFCKDPHVVIHNFAINVLDDFIPWEERDNRLIYIGNVNEHRGAITMIQGFAMSGLNEFELMIIGNPDDPLLISRLYYEANALGIGDRVVIKGYMPLGVAKEYIKRSKLGLSLLHPYDNYIGSLPTKVFDYLSCRIPALISNFKYYQEFFKNVPSIFFVNPLDIHQISDRIREIVLNCSDKSLNESYSYFVKYFSWQQEEKKLLNLYDGLLNK